MTMENRGILVVVSGFSGAGKGTIMNALLDKYDFSLSISATTRRPREGEEDGRHYFFKTREEFEQMIKDNDLIEWAEYVGNYYGTPKSYVEKQLEQGKDVLLEIEMQGGMLVKEQFPDAALVFITTPSAQILHDRLVGRGTEDLETIKQRLSRAAEEASYMKQYDYIIVNDVLDETVEKVHNVINAEHFKTKHQEQMMQQMSTQLEAFKKGTE